MSMIDEVTDEDLRDYADEHYEEPLEELSDGFVFEALCEKIVEKNPSYKMGWLADEFSTEDVSRKEFAEMKFDKVVSDDSDLIKEAHKESWVEATYYGVIECR